MALRIIRKDSDPLLRKESREVKEINDRIKILIEDMVETMIHAEGVGLAAPQVGVLRRVITVDVGEGMYRMINPKIIEKDGSDISIEACLSVPDRMGMVERPEKVKVQYMDLEGDIKIIEAEGLFARALCHEIDHLNGILYTDIMLEEVFDHGEDYNE